MRKKYVLYFVSALLCFTCYGAQSGNNADNFVKELEREINTSLFNKKIFNDTVTFEFSGKVIPTTQERTQKVNWNRLKVLFKGTDYIVIPYPNRNRTIVFRVQGLNKYFEVKNHNYSFIFGVNNQGKIALIQEVKIELPPNAPPIPIYKK
ncbi:MAG: hypothetical protein U0264_10880 [Candidatus Kapaibacterium sp.]